MLQTGVSMVKLLVLSVAVKKFLKVLMHAYGSKNSWTMTTSMKTVANHAYRVLLLHFTLLHLNTPYKKYHCNSKMSVPKQGPPANWQKANMSNCASHHSVRRNT